MAGRNAGRNDEALAAAMQAIALAFQHPPNADENAGSRSLATFQRENPLLSKESMILKML